MNSSTSAHEAVSPRPYQQEVLISLEEQSDRNQIVHLAFGAGKTLIALWEMIRRRKVLPAKKILYLSAGEGGYDRARQALDMALRFGLQSDLGFCLDPKSMLDGTTRQQKETAWDEANVIFGPLQAVWNALDLEVPKIKDSIGFIVIDEFADIVARDLTGWRFHKPVFGLMNFARENKIPILGLTGSLDPSRLNAIGKLTGSRIIAKPEIKPFEYEYSTLLVNDQDIQRLDSLFGAGLQDCTKRASDLIDYPLTVELMYELLYGGLMNRLYKPTASFSKDSSLLEKVKSNEDRTGLLQILRYFHLYAHGRVIALNSTPDHLLSFLEKYRLPRKMLFSLKEVALTRWEKTALSPKVLRTVIPIRHASEKFPVVVFGRFISLVNQCQKVLEANGVKAHQLTGKTKPPTRRMILQEFRDGEYPVLVLSPLGTRGLDLPEVGAVFHLDITQSIDIIAQRSARIRGGHVCLVICKNTSEEGKLKLLEEKLGSSTHYNPPLSPFLKDGDAKRNSESTDDAERLTDDQRALLDWYEHSDPTKP